MRPLEIAAAGELLRSGGIVAIPTETVYGLAARADLPEAVARIFEAKGRPDSDPLIVHIADPDQLPTVAADLPPEAELLARRFWPGPLTLVLPKQPIIPDAVTSGLPTVAVRLPAHPTARRLIEAAGFPLAAPSANRFGRTSPTATRLLDPELLRETDGFVEGGECEVGVESTIIGFFPHQPPVLLRPGGIPIEEIVEVIGPVAPVATVAAVAEKGGDRPLSPGRMPSHYAPKTPLRLIDRLTPDERREIDGGAPIARLTFGASRSAATAVEAGWNRIGGIDLSPRRDLKDAARNLYRAIIELDRLDARYIVAELLPDYGLGRAVNDRLLRASTSNQEV